MSKELDRVFMDSGLQLFNPAPVDMRCEALHAGNLDCGIRSVVTLTAECQCGERATHIFCGPHFLRALEVSQILAQWTIALMLQAKLGPPTGLGYFAVAPPNEECQGDPQPNLICWGLHKISTSLPGRSGEEPIRTLCIPHFLREVEKELHLSNWTVETLLAAKTTLPRTYLNPPAMWRGGNDGP